MSCCGFIACLDGPCSRRAALRRSNALLVLIVVVVIVVVLIALLVAVLPEDLLLDRLRQGCDTVTAVAMSQLCCSLPAVDQGTARPTVSHLGVQSDAKIEQRHHSFTLSSRSLKHLLTASLRVTSSRDPCCHDIVNAGTSH